MQDFVGAKARAEPVAVLVAVVFVRSWAGWLGLISFVVPYVVIVWVFAQEGPGGSLLIAGDGLGLAWLYGGTLAIVVASVLPPRLLGRAGPPRTVERPADASNEEGEADRVASA